MTGQSIGLSEQRQDIRYGKTCGCPHCPQNIIHYMLEYHAKNSIQYTIGKKKYYTANYIDRITNVSDLDEWIVNVDQLVSVLTASEWMDICLCEDWRMEFENPENFRQHGYSDRMFLALSKRYGKNEANQYYFPVRQILPVLEQPHEPMLLVLTSLHFREQILGYIATAYQKPEDIHLDETYINWCDAAAAGLNNLQQKQYTSYIRQQMERLSVHDPATGLRNRRGLAEKLPDFLLTCRKSEVTPILLLLTCKEKMPEDYDIIMLVRALKRSVPEQAILARVQKRLFAVLLTDQTDPEQMIHQTEICMWEMFGDGLHPPQLITFSQPFGSSALGDAERIIDNAILTIHRKAEANPCKDYKEQLHRLRREMQVMPQKDWSVAEIANKVGISRSHLQRLYKELFQISILDDLITVRIEKAEQLLAHTKMRIAEVAAACGYRNPTHFMRQFKEKKGITATQYRKQQKK